MGSGKLPVPTGRAGRTPGTKAVVPELGAFCDNTLDLCPLCQTRFNGRTVCWRPCWKCQMFGCAGVNALPAMRKSDAGGATTSDRLSVPG